jgi:hypothetical protein
LPSGSEDPLPSKFTVSGAGPFVGDAVATAIGGWFAAPDPARWGEFTQRYRELYAEPPPRLIIDLEKLQVVPAERAGGRAVTARPSTRPEPWQPVAGHRPGSEGG